MKVYRGKLAVAFVAMCLLVMGVGVAATRVTSDSDEPAVSAEAEADFFDRLNGARAEAGLPVFVQDAELTRIARDWSTEMASAGVLSHNPGNRLTENVGTGSNVGQVHDAFMASPAHRANILAKDKTHVGIGVVIDGRDVWVTEDFRKQVAPPVTVPPPVPASPTTKVPSTPRTTAACSS